MKLTYIYIEKFRGVENLSYNLDSGIRFSYREGKVIAQRVSKALRESFFRVSERPKSKVVSVSALVGANGSGKTTIASFLELFLTCYSDMPHFVLVLQDKSNGQDVREGEQVDQAHYILYCNLPDDVNELDVSGMDVACDIRYWRDRFNFPETRRLDSIFDFIYYSPHFSTERVVGLRDGCVVAARERSDAPIEERVESIANDIANPRRYVWDLSQTGMMWDSNRKNTSPNGYLWRWTTDERVRIYDFLHEARKRHANVIESQFAAFLRCPHATIRAMDSVWRSFVKDLEIDAVDVIRTDAQLMDAANRRYLRFTNIEYDASFVSKTFWYYVAVVARDVLFSNLDRNPYDDHEDIKRFLEFCETLEDVHIDRNLTGRELSLALLEKLHAVEGAIKCVACILPLLEELSPLDVSNQDALRFPFGEGHDEDIIKFKKIMTCHDRLGLKYPILMFGFDHPFSSGEMSYIGMWAHLYEYCRGQQNISKNLVVFIDEAETSLHPQWQLLLVRNMIFFWENFVDGLNVQMVFASHSPMLVSDLPSGNVAYLGSTEEEHLPEVFGANIFDLYRKGFFLEDGTVGAFAQKKIDDLVRKVFVIVSGKEGDEVDLSISDEDRQLVDLIADKELTRYLREWLRVIDNDKDIIR